MTGPQLQAHYDALGSDQRARETVRAIRRQSARPGCVEAWHRLAGGLAGLAFAFTVAPLVARLMS